MTIPGHRNPIDHYEETGKIILDKEIVSPRTVSILEKEIKGNKQLLGGLESFKKEIIDAQHSKDTDFHQLGPTGPSWS